MKRLQKLALVLALAVVFTSVGGYLATTLPATAETEVDTKDPNTVLTAYNPIPDIADRVRPAVVQVISFSQSWNMQTREVTEVETGYGSGVYIDDRGYIVTNNHVIADAERVEILWLDGTRMDAEIVGTDSSTDLAVLKFEGDVDATPVPLGDSDSLRIGELAIAIGNPGTAATVLYGTVTFGIISGLDRSDIKASGSYTRAINVIQTTAQINSGNSGGALLNGNGELVGIPTLKSSFSYGSVIEGTAFAIPVNTAKPIIAELIEHGQVIRPRIGVTITNFSNGPEEPMRNYPPVGAMIINVEEGAPAEEAGLLPYDIITHVNGQRCRSFDAMTSLIDQYAEGDVITLTVARYFAEYNPNTGAGTLLPSAQRDVFDVDVELKILD